MTFKPYPWLTFFTLLVFAALITLGVWQVQRYEQKQKLNTDILAYANATPVNLASILSDQPVLNHKYRPVQLTGEYLPQQQILVRGQYKKSDRVVHYGFYVFTPFKFEHNDQTKHLMIERGFITENSYNAPNSYKQLPVGTTQVTGHIKAAEKQGSFFPDNDMAAENWFWRDIVAMGQKLQLTNAQDFYISLSENKLQDFPKPTKIEIRSASNHLSYLITWFALAAGLLILYIYMHVYNGRLYLDKNRKNETFL